ncbi:testis-expressed protein 13B [Daubentonia madagascariensis]|uniref:Testis-expressed protein 13B n=1 Tax=Daubentonia madagascariensis TaxID=31869 RepID=A0ABD2DNK3_DAUMA
MALKPDDPCGGFQHGKVVAFINEKMAGHVKGPEFYLENMSLSWEEVEDKLNAILEDSEVPSQAKEACAWGGLALGVRFARRQGQLQGRRVQWLHDFAKLHKSAAQALASDLKELTAQQEMERKEAAFQLRLTQANLARVQREQELLRWKLLQTELRCPREQEQATATGDQGGEEEEMEAAAAAAGAAEGGGGEEERDAEAGAASTEAAQELDGSLLQLLGAVEKKNYPSGGAEGGKSQVSGNSHVFFPWDPGARGHRLTRAPSGPAPCLIHILILMPFVPLLSWTQSIPTSSNGHSTTSTSDASPLGGL